MDETHPRDLPAYADLDWPTGDRNRIAELMGADLVDVERDDGTTGTLRVWPDLVRWPFAEQVLDLLADNYHAAAALQRRAVLIARIEQEGTKIAKVNGAPAFLANVDLVVTIHGELALHLLDPPSREEGGMSREDGQERLVHLLDLMLARVSPNGALVPKTWVEPAYVVRRWGAALLGSSRDLMRAQLDLGIVSP